MTRMSDALRAAAETAPVADVHVSSAAATSRVRRARLLRTSANGIVGVGAAAIVVAGIMGAVANQTAIAESAGGDGNRDTVGIGAPSVNDAAVAPSDGDPSMVPCGTGLDLSTFPAGNVTSSATLDDKDVPILLVKLTYTSATTDAVTFGAPIHYVLWHDIVVASAQGDSVPTSWDPASTPALEVTSGIKLYNCWDSAELPAGDYTVVTVTPVNEFVMPLPEPTAAPVEPSAPVQPSATPSTSATDPDTSVSSDANFTSVPPVYAVTDAVPYTIPGEPVENPFDAYLKVPVDPTPLPTAPAGPDDALTTDEAKAAYAAALTTARWDMAPGTQRVVLTSSSDDLSADLWAQSYYGCPTEGANASFPAQSADLNWLDVNANLPSSIHVSYGWVVDGNPLVTYGLKNVTDWSLPGFYEGGTPRLVLVKDGRVVAEAYPVNADQGGGPIAYATEGTAPADADSSDSSGGRDSLIWAPAGDGYLAPGESVSGDYLWRDLNGCWTESGPSTVSPGTYTVLTAQDIYVGGQYAIMTGGGIADASTSDSSKAIAPAPDASGSYVSFQVWTSLGTLTVTN